MVGLWTQNDTLSSNITHKLHPIVRPHGELCMQTAIFQENYNIMTLHELYKKSIKKLKRKILEAADNKHFFVYHLTKKSKKLVWADIVH